MKNSSHKKTGQFFKYLQKLGLIEYKEAKKNSSPMIVKISFGNEEIKNWIPTMWSENDNK